MIELNKLSTASVTSSVPVLFGVGAIAKIGSKVKEFGKSKAAVICDKGIRTTGIADLVCGHLTDSGIEYAVFDGVTPDPLDSVVDEAVAFIKENSCDCIVCVGGGAALDTGKAASIIAVSNASAADICSKKASPVYPGICTIAVPTTAGTGSEGSGAAVITLTETGHKGGVANAYADLAIIDPELTVGLPQSLTATTGMDALSHAIETMLGSSMEAWGTNPFVDVYSEAAIRYIVKYLPRAYADGTDIEARSYMAFAANIAAMGLGEVLLGLGHPIAHSMGALFHIPHGAACAAALPQAIRWLGAYRPERIRIIADSMNVSYGDDDDAAAIADAVSDAVKAFGRSIGIKSYKELGLTPGDIEALAESAVNENSFKIACEPKATKGQVIELIMEDYEG